VVVEARAPAVIYVRLELAICRELLAEQLLPFVDLIAQDLLAAHRAPHHGLRRLLSDQLDRRRPLERVDVNAVGALARRLALLPQIAILLLKLSADLPAPNIDLAMGALAYCADMPADALPLLFAVSRCTGWVAHYLEELDETPLRFRARAVHVTSR
jgi:hypothetical protein